MSGRPAALQRGLDAYHARLREEAIARVDAYTAWLRERRPAAEIPPIPTKNDYRLAKEVQRP